MDVKISRKRCSKKQFLRSSTTLIIMIFTLIQVFPSFVFAATSGEVIGTFAAKAPPTVDSVAVKTTEATAVVPGDTLSASDITDVNAALLDLSGANVLSFTLNGTTIVLNGSAGDYTTIGDIATSIQSQLDTDSNTTVTVDSSGADGHLELTGAAGQNIVIVAGSGTLSSIGLSAGTETATTSEATSLSPNSVYNVEVTVTEPDGLGSDVGGLDTIVTKIWYDTDGSNNLQAYFDLQTTPSTTKYAVITWDKTSNTATLDAGTGSSWTLQASTLPTTEILADPTEITYTFIFPIQIGKIANITADPARWQVAAKATDTDASTAYNYLATPLEMNWYGEITLPEGTTADWGRINAGIDFADTSAKLSIAGMELLSNGEYYERIKASSTWSDNATTPTTATRSTDAALNNEFAIVADNDSTYDVGTAAVIPADGTSTIALNASSYAANTTYTTRSVENYLYIKLNSTFPQGKIFEGTITYLISDSGA